MFSGSTIAQGTGSQELGPGRVETRGSQDYRKRVEEFLAGQTNKVVGGAVAPAGAYPWQVALLVSWIAEPHQAQFCGGSIRNSKWIVTAAHCVTGNQPQDIHVVAGVNVLSPGAVRVNVKRIISHRNYNADTQDNDIALLETLNDLALDDRKKAIELLTVAEEDQALAAGQMLTVTGWGATQQGGSTVRDLRFVDIPPVTRATCNQPASYHNRITENMICAGRALGGQDSCQGDSGGPLVTKSATTPKLAGVVSWGEGCAQAGKYGVYTRVTRYNQWVDQCMAQPSSC
jgi:secreted trypsin-like serine protease